MAHARGTAIDGTGVVGPAGVSTAWALEFLLERGLLTPTDAVSGAVEAEELSTSHRSFCVRVGGQPRWFVKRADPIHSRGRDLGMEATAYSLAAGHQSSC